MFLRGYWVTAGRLQMIDKPIDADICDFDVVWRGYDRGQVKAYLAEVGVSLRQLETRSQAAEDRLRAVVGKTLSHRQVDRNLIADSVPVDRVLGGDRANAIAARVEQNDRTRLERNDRATKIVDEAKEEARRIVETALLANGPVKDEPDLEDARVEAKRIFEEAIAVADRLRVSSEARVQDVEVEPTDSLVVDLTPEIVAD